MKIDQIMHETGAYALSLFYELALLACGDPK
jgi:hypothetical protein